MRVLYFQTALSLALIFTLSSCSSVKKLNAQDFLITESGFAVKQTPYSQEKASEDMKVLLHFFKHGYAGYDFINSRKIKKATSSLNVLSKKDSDSWAELCSSIAEIFKNLPDGHLKAYLNENCLNSKKLKRTSNIGKNIAINTYSKAFLVSYQNKNGESFGVLGIKKFPSFNDKKWTGFEKAIDELKRNSATIIIDLRGNGGGDDTRGLQLAGKLKGENIITNNYALDYEPTNPETYVLLLNKITSKEKNSSKEAWAYHRGIVESKLKNPSKKKYESSKNDLPLKVKESERPYNKPIYVLIDARCGSSGESTAQALKTLKNVTLVGQNTAGVTHFGNQGTLILPNSRMRIAMSTKFIKFRDGSFVEKTGHKPDLFVPDGTDALSFVLNL